MHSPIQANLCISWAIRCIIIEISYTIMENIPEVLKELQEIFNKGLVEEYMHCFRVSKTLSRMYGPELDISKTQI